MPRKIIQISATPETEHGYHAIAALCDDGTVWVATLRDGGQTVWQSLAPIPHGPAAVPTMLRNRRDAVFFAVMVVLFVFTFLATGFVACYVWGK